MTCRIPRSTFFRTLLAGAVAFGVLLAGWMAASPELHEHLHHEAGHADHTCLATMIASGGCESTVMAPLVAAVSINWEESVLPMRSQWVPPMFLDTGLLVHAPPARI